LLMEHNNANVHTAYSKPTARRMSSQSGDFSPENTVRLRLFKDYLLQ
jgi:hypothetical protein